MFQIILFFPCLDSLGTVGWSINLYGALISVLKKVDQLVEQHQQIYRHYHDILTLITDVFYNDSLTTY